MYLRSRKRAGWKTWVRSTNEIEQNYVKRNPMRYANREVMIDRLRRPLERYRTVEITDGRAFRKI